MTFFKKIPDLRQSAWGWRAPGLLVALVLVFQPQKATAQQTQTITLSTGLVGQAGTTLTALWHLDDDWLVTADPINTAVPRSANVVSTDKKWPAPFPHSQWISAAGNKYLYALQGRNRTPFTYQSCFNLPQFFSAPKLTMQLRADDIIRRVKLNNTIIFEDPDANAKAG
ncbi:MAG: hypothetical protein ACXWCH_35400, partial [Burkholderiales bacterium]